MAAFQFPDPAVTQTVTNPTTGTVYQWQESSSKWVVTINNDDTFVSVVGDTMTGPLVIDPPGPIDADTALLQLDNTNGNVDQTILNIESTSAASVFKVKNDSLVSNLTSFQLNTPGTANADGTVGFNLRDGDNANLLTQYRDNTNTIGDSVRYVGEILDNKDLTTKQYVDTAVSNGQIVTIAPTAPLNPNDGDLWFDSSQDSLTLFVYYKASFAWIPAAPPSTLEGRIEEGEQIQQEIISNLNQAKDDIIQNEQNHAELSNKVEALEGVTTQGNWQANISGGNRPGDFTLYTDNTMPAILWSTTDSIGLQSIDKNGINHSFSTVAITDTIRIRYSNASASSATFKITGIKSAGWYEVELTSAIGDPIDDEVYSVEFLPSFDPSAYATVDYVDNQDDLKVNLTGGDLTGNLTSTAAIDIDGRFTSRAGGKQDYGFALRDQGSHALRFGIWHPNSIADTVKYATRNGAYHLFTVNDNFDQNQEDVLAIKWSNIEAYKSFNLFSPGQFYLKTNSGTTLFSMFRQTDTEARLNVSKGKGFKITGTYNNTLESLIYVNTSGQVAINRLLAPTKDHQAANKAYVDSKVPPNATSSVKGVAKLGQMPQGSSVPSLDKGQMFYNTASKVLLIKT